MYSVKRPSTAPDAEGREAPRPPAAPHRDLSPELREVMHLLAMLELGKATPAK